jgi:hypothetical protein
VQERQEQESRLTQMVKELQVLEQQQERRHLDRMVWQLGQRGQRQEGRQQLIQVCMVMVQELLPILWALTRLH